MFIISLLVKNSTLEFKSGGLYITKSRNDVFYKREGQIIKAHELLKSGKYSGREVSKICGISQTTIVKLIKKNRSLRCVCGVPLYKHKGWCSYRYSKSEKRQQAMKNILNKGKDNNTFFDIKELYKIQKEREQKPYEFIR